MTSGAVWKVILRFAFPLLIGNLLQQLYNVTDSVIVGQFLGKESLAAVSASFFIYYFIISLLLFLYLHVGRRGIAVHSGNYFCRADVQADEHTGGRDPAGGRLF